MRLRKSSPTIQGIEDFLATMDLQNVAAPRKAITALQNGH